MHLVAGNIINEKWKVEKVFEPSGQGQSAIISSVNDLECKRVIKCLKDDKNTICVKRFHQEINLMKKLSSIERIPKMYEYDMGENYYMMDYINGPCLAEAIQIKSNKKQFNKIMNAIMQLLWIVKNYTEMGVVHRDIKPANIICKDGNIEDLYLIDFGIGFDKDNEEDLTKINVQLGNRFLKLPELLVGNKRDIRSDITQCVGIFFFMLTGTPPVSLTNESEEMPHQTDDAIVKLQWIGSKNLEIVNRIFDKGFRNNIQERYQCVKDLIFALNEINLHKVSDKSRATYFKKTDSYCLTTIKEIIDCDPYYREDMLRRLKLYNNKVIAIGNIFFREREDKIYICLDRNNLLDTINDSHKYHCGKFGALYVKKKKGIEELLMKETSLFELAGEMKLKDNIIDFDNFIIKSESYEIPVKRSIELPIRFQFEEEVVNVICQKDRVVFLNRNSYWVLNLNQNGSKTIEQIDLNYLFKNNSSYVLSENLIWIVYIQDEILHIAKLEDGKYIESRYDKIMSVHGRILDFKVWNNSLFILQKNKLRLFDLVRNEFVELYKERNPFYKLKNIYRIIPESRSIIICNQYGQKIYINLETKSYMKDEFFKFHNYVPQIVNSKKIYVLGSESIRSMDLCDQSEEYIYDLNRNFMLNIEARGFELNEIKCISNDLYFWVLKEKESRFDKVNKLVVYKLENNKFKEVWNFEDVYDIKQIWVYVNYVIAIDICNNTIIWRFAE